MSGTTQGKKAETEDVLRTNPQPSCTSSVYMYNYVTTHIVVHVQYKRIQIDNVADALRSIHYNAPM